MPQFYHLLIEMKCNSFNNKHRPSGQVMVIEKKCGTLKPNEQQMQNSSFEIGHRPQDCAVLGRI
jgi:hypothetical protein